ncbi:uncharacterized protein LOC123641302 [Lemur catta]|uniref:uncharacterized protein LOC123641302 n=1 Tax=Lemur catta TaxID=9447 RepID=UPI001E268C36|nr:uncharacterized protein LOC123641302 [Lemur catta]XP_045411867.1 uncharacterized protein LOC123641302 [Lemur catta]XP_045411868.1 uncharacterized protein LOC123641302 [Lemur catta]XP_045411869.1 uncharacterized protein LOC123641302 [Lemur catta]XP_045411870.1 uncharacterized protein LOC123641302 [Lemur catta]XP_045411871.1 uncharacterized protein LOC123641302 [Lemur catta]XP_045411872.1 uncharacterized protein LOC123641302 [Lemur catta]XP_045411873.1 uncharacterized protein LOC123641302 [
MFMEKGVLLGFPHLGVRKRRGKPHRRTGERDGAGSRGAPSQARSRGRSPLERSCQGAQVLREKVWVPWNGLIVIGKRVELLGRNTPKPRMWDPKLDSEYWTMEDVEKMVLREKSDPTEERMNVKLLPSVADASQASADMGKDSPRKILGKQEVKRKTGAESKSAGMTAGSRRGSGIEENVRSTGERVDTNGKDLRSRGHKMGPNEKKLRSGGEELTSSGEKLRSSGEKLRSSGEKLRSSGENLRSSGENLRLSGENLRSSGEKLRSSGENLRSSGEKLRSSGEKLRSSGENLRSSGENLRSSGEKLRSSGENLIPSREKLKLSGKKLRSSGEDLTSIGDKLGSTEDNLGTSGEKLERPRMESINEETEKVIKVTGDERLIEFTDDEMEVLFERVKGSDELERTEEEVEVEGDIVGEVKDITDESVNMEEKDIIGEGTSA